MNKWSHVELLWNPDRGIIFLQTSISAEHSAKVSKRICSTISFERDDQNLRKLKWAHGLDACGSLFASNAIVVFNMSFIVKQRINAVINIEFFFGVRDNGRNIQKGVEIVYAVTAFLTLKCTDVITKEHFLDF